MRLVDIERKIKSTIEESGLSDPEAYENIYSLCFEFLYRGKKMSTRKDTEEVASLMAEELYMKLVNGGSIISWLGYISKCYHAYIRMWRGMNKSEIIDTEDNYNVYEAVINMSTGMDNKMEYQKVVDKEYLMVVPSVIDGVMKRSRYVFDTKEFINAKLSIILSIAAGKFINYGNDDINSMYTNMLFQYTVSEISRSIINNASADDAALGNFTALQLFAMENIQD